MSVLSKIIKSSAAPVGCARPKGAPGRDKPVPYGRYPAVVILAGGAQAKALLYLFLGELAERLILYESTAILGSPCI